MHQARQAVAAGALRRPPARGLSLTGNLARGPRAMDHQARAGVSDPLRLVRDPWAGGRCARCLGRCRWLLLPGPWPVGRWPCYLVRELRALVRATWCAIPGPSTWCRWPCPLRPGAWTPAPG